MNRRACLQLLAAVPLAVVGKNPITMPLLSRAPTLPDLWASLDPRQRRAFIDRLINPPIVVHETTFRGVDEVVAPGEILYVEQRLAPLIPRWR